MSVEISIGTHTSDEELTLNEADLAMLAGDLPPEAIVETPAAPEPDWAKAQRAAHIPQGYVDLSYRPLQRPA